MVAPSGGVNVATVKLSLFLSVLCVWGHMFGHTENERTCIHTAATTTRHRKFVEFQSVCVTFLISIAIT